MTEVVYIIVPVAVLVLLLKICLICWRVWAYQQRRQRVVITQQRAVQRTRAQRVQAPAVARVVGVERCVTDDGAFAQRTSYTINQPGHAPRHFQRTIVIRPADNRRPNDPNLPPTYDMAVTGKDKSITVEKAGTTQAPPTSGATAVPPTQLPPTQPPPPHVELPIPPLAPSEPPAYTSMSVAPPTLPTTHEEEEDVAVDDRARLLP